MTVPLDRPSRTEAEFREALAAFRAQARAGVFATAHYRMRYFVWGSGSPLVFIHGMSDSARAFALVMHPLAAKFTCIAYELPDGKTDGSRLVPYRYNDYVEDLLELLDYLGHPQAALVGSSFGTTIALAALARHGNRFSHAILQGGFAYRPLSTPQRILCHLARYWPGWFADWPGLYRRIIRKVEQPTSSILSPEVMEFLLQNGGRTPIRTAALRSIAIDRVDLRPLLPTIATPILLLGGGRDPLVPRTCEDVLEKGLPNAKRVIFPNCGHYPHYTHPARMAAEIEVFLRQ
jgi:pimeloyl-ACP methyl ester carboxylesterase